MDDSSLGGEFHTTRWSRIILPDGGSHEQSNEAIEYLCQVYWKPLYAFVRRSGHSYDEAQDIVQSFLVHLMDKPEFLLQVDQSKGRFRSYLLGALKYFLLDRKKSSNTQKRGGHLQKLSYDLEEFENSHSERLSNNMTPSEGFDLEWAFTIFETAVNKLKVAASSDFDQEIFLWITGQSNCASPQDLANKINASQEAVRMRISRARSQLRRFIDQEIKETISNEADFDDERSYILQLIQKNG